MHAYMQTWGAKFWGVIGSNSSYGGDPILGIQGDLEGSVIVSAIRAYPSRTARLSRCLWPARPPSVWLWLPGCLRRGHQGAPRPQQKVALSGEAGNVSQAAE